MRVHVDQAASVELSVGLDAIVAEGASRMLAAALEAEVEASVHFKVRLEEARLCALVIVGVRVDGTKELVDQRRPPRVHRVVGRRLAGPASPRNEGTGARRR